MDQSAERLETCSLTLVRRIAGMLDQDSECWSQGDLLPRGWHFVLIGADTRRSTIRPDGFPGLGIALPDLGLARVVLGGRTVRYNGDIQVGTTLRRQSTIQSVSQKETATGPTAVVTVRHSLYAAREMQPVLEEAQTFLLLSGRYSAAKAGDNREQALPAQTKRLVPDDLLLFQYSALGFNSHRIHLDRAFATSVEGLPDLVVNGGLVTLLLTEFLRLDLQGSFKSLRARHLAPLFSNRPVILGGERKEDGWCLRAWDDEGRLAVDIETTM